MVISSISWTRPGHAPAEAVAWPTDPRDTAQLAQALQQLDKLEADMAGLEQRIARLDSDARKAHVRSRLAAQAVKLSLGLMVGGVFTAVYFPEVGMATSAVGILGMIATGLGMLWEEEKHQQAWAQSTLEQGRALQRQQILDDLRVLAADVRRSNGIEERNGSLVVGGVAIRRKGR